MFRNYSLCKNLYWQRMSRGFPGMSQHWRETVSIPGPVEQESTSMKSMKVRGLQNFSLFHIVDRKAQGLDSTEIAGPLRCCLDLRLHPEQRHTYDKRKIKNNNQKLHAKQHYNMFWGVCEMSECYASPVHPCCPSPSWECRPHLTLQKRIIFKNIHCFKKSNTCISG
jgi:hypothetical protein